VADVADGRGKTDVADSSTGRLEQRIAELEAENVRLSEALQAASRRCPRREHDDARDSERQPHLILDSATDYAVLTTDLERRVTSWSAGAEATLGYAAHEIVGRSGDVLFTPEDQSAGIPKQEAETARRDGLAPDVRWHQRRDGSRVFFDGSTRLLRDRDGREVGFLKVVRDETERRRSDEALQVAGERAAAEAAEREAILGQLAEGVIVTDAKGCITFVNEAAERLHGVKMLGVGPETYTEAYHLLTEAGDPYPPHDLPLARAALQGETVTDARWRIRRPDGTEVLAIGSAKPILGPDGSRLGAVLTVRDDSERSRAEERVREGEARLRAISDNLPSGMVYQMAMDRDGTNRRFTYVSRGCEPLTGVSVAAALADPRALYKTIEPEHRSGLASAEEHAIRTLSHFDQEVAFRRTDGALRWGRIISAPRCLPDGSIVWDGLKIDITERKRSEEALARRSAQLQGLAEAALAVARAPTLEATLDEITQAARSIIGAHQGVVSLTRGPDWSQAINAVALTDKYQRWSDYAEMPDGSGIYAWACEQNRPVRLTQAALEAHPRWRNFGKHANEHPPMRGWLAAPLIGRDGRNLGLIQLSDKEDGSEFDESDEAMLVQLAQLASAAVEQSQVETALAEKAAEFEALAENVSQLAWMAEPEGHIFWYNKRWYDYTGTTLEIMQGWGWREVHHPDYIDRVIAEIQANWARGEPWEGTYLLRGKDGVYRPFLTRAEPIRDATGKLIRWFGTNTDITAQREAETRLRRVLDQLFAFVGVTTTDGILLEANRAPLEAAGIAAEDVIGKPFWDSYWWSYDASVQAHLKDAVARAASGEVVRYDVRVRMAGGELVTIDFQIAPLRDDEGRITHLIPSATVIEERVRAQNELKELNATLESRVAEEVAERAKAEEALRQAQKMEAVGQLTGGIAHDFNNLLTGVIGSLDMMQRRIAKGETDRIERYATAAMTSANRAAALTHRLLAFSRRQPLDPKPVNANRLVTGMEELLRRTIGEAIRLEIVTAGGLWQTLCDPHQLESAILNLAINARDAMQDGGQLTIETCNAHLDNAYAAQQREVKPGQYICICVTDTGTGMSPDVIAKAFDPFFTTKPIGQGTGLGLSMIYGFARQSEGYAKIYSEVGQGTTVKLYLPRYYGEAEDAEEASARLAEAHRAEHGEVVLVVEDETAVRDLVADVLEELGYRALEAADGPSGLKLLQSDMRVDLLVTDVGLPGLNGRQLADAARERRPNLKILFMTGYAENAAIANGFLEPGMQMITKPFAIEALAARIRDMLEMNA
jgi:PAS domain S-box-containing protein